MSGAPIKHITSADNPHYKLLKKISGASRERRKLGQTLLDGVHLLEAFANANGELRLLVLRAGAETAPEIALCMTRFSVVPTLVLSESLFDAISPVDHPTGILGLMPIPQPPLHRVDCCVLLENIQDPGNLGSILRTAAAADADAVYLSTGCAEAWSPKALRAGMGAHFKLAIHEQQDLTQIADRFDAVFATSLAATQSIYTSDLTGKVAFLFGNEGAGLSAPMLALATQPITIPMPGKIESLNVAAAVAVCLFERVRQLLLKPV